MQSLLQDFRYSLRQLVKNPGFALTAILSLALGIGATVSVFSVIYGVLMHPFPYADVERMANLSLQDGKGNIFDAGFNGQQLRELRRVQAFQRHSHVASKESESDGAGDSRGHLRLLWNRRDVPYAGSAGIAGARPGTFRFA